MNETSTAPRASARRPSRGARLTRLVTLLAVAATIGAVSSVVTAGIAVSSFYESRRLRAQLEETRIGLPGNLPLSSSSASTPSPPPRAPLDYSAWDALPKGEPIEIDGALIDATLANLSELAPMARIVPAFENGRSVGFKLFSIKPTSLYATMMKLQNGDVVRRINGFELLSPESGLEIYTKLKDASAVRVDVQRRGEPIRLDYVIVR